MPLLIIFLIGISFTPFSFSDSIPEWVKNNAEWWSERTISQSEFTTGLEFLINEGIIYIPPTEPGIPGPDKIIPDWVRNTAGWWSQNKIPDSEFINAMKYLIEIGIIEVDASSPEIIDEDVVETLSEDDDVIGKPLHMVTEGYKFAHTDGKYVLDVLIFDAEKYTGNNFNRNADYLLDNVNIDISLYHEDSKIHEYNGLTNDGFLRYDVMAKQTENCCLWLINNLYTVNVIASLDGQTIEKNFEFLGRASAYYSNHGSAIRAPTNLSATAGDDQVSLTWTAPSGVKGITDYKIQFSTDGSIWTTFSDGVSSTASTTVTGLDDSTLYYFRVAAENYSGLGKYTSVVFATTT